MRILIIEDDERLTRLIKSFFEQKNYCLDVAYDGNFGLEMILSGAHTVAIVDWMLPGRDGPAICRAVRNARLPVALLMLTARSQIEDRISGLDNGADDYLTKPFDLDELLARVRALSRRFTPIEVIASDPNELRCGDITLDVRAHTARRGNIGLNLTKKEWQVLECLMRHPQQALSREQIFQQVWAYDSQVQVTIVDLYISYVRHKLCVSLDLPDPIETVRGVGYRFNMR
jgi:two-component system, OmpR family, response regulator